VSHPKIRTKSLSTSTQHRYIPVFIALGSLVYGIHTQKYIYGFAKTTVYLHHALRLHRSMVNLPMRYYTPEFISVAIRKKKCKPVISRRKKSDVFHIIGFLMRIIVIRLSTNLVNDPIIVLLDILIF
jgi:hypothetical protein